MTPAGRSAKYTTMRLESRQRIANLQTSGLGAAACRAHHTGHLFKVGRTGQSADEQGSSQQNIVEIESEVLLISRVQPTEFRLRSRARCC
jgi:hypothetical protein